MEPKLLYLLAGLGLLMLLFYFSKNNNKKQETNVNLEMSDSEETARYCTSYPCPEYRVPECKKGQQPYPEGVPKDYYWYEPECNCPAPPRCGI